MLRRTFWLAVGTLLGFGSSWYVTRRVKRFVARWTPQGVKDRVSTSLHDLGLDVRQAVYEGRLVMRAREDELRRSWDPGTTPPALPAPLVTAADDDRVVEAGIVDELGPRRSARRTA